jgi:hypothetical protein
MYIHAILDWNTQYVGAAGWLAILCTVLSLYAAIVILKSGDLLIRSEETTAVNKERSPDHKTK